MSYHFTPFRTAIVKRQMIISVGDDVEKVEPSYMANENIKWFSYFGMQFGSSSKS